MPTNKPTNLTESKFCRHCGEKLVPRDVEGKMVPWCLEHGGDFRSPTVAANILIPTHDGGIVLIFRKKSPEGWACPGGYSDTNELPEQTAVREAYEETGLTVEIERVLFHYILHNKNVLAVFYLAKPISEPPIARSDARAASVFYIGHDDFDPCKMLSDLRYHQKAINMWLALRSELPPPP